MYVMQRTLPLLEKNIHIRLSTIKELDEEVKLYSHYYYICVLLSPYINADVHLNTILDIMIYVKRLLSDGKRELRKARLEYQAINSW